MDFYPVGSGLKNALCRNVMAANAAVEATGELLLTPGAPLDPYLKAVRRWMWLRKKLENLIMEEDFSVWEHPPSLLPIELGTGEGEPSAIDDDFCLVIGDFSPERRQA